MKRNDLPSYGLDAEIKAKLDSKYDPEMEAEARQWIAAVSGEPFPAGNFQAALKSGVVLCKVANKLKPNAVPKINTNNMAFMQMENISAFLNFCYSIGVQKTDSFQTIDLYEAQNMQQVVVGIHALARVASAKGLTKHSIGPKQAEANPRNFTEAQLNAGKNVPSQQVGNNLGASQAGMRAGWSRQIDESPFIQ